MLLNEFWHGGGDCAANDNNDGADEGADGNARDDDDLAGAPALCDARKLLPRGAPALTDVAPPIARRQ